jgi:hypothetical protein
VDPNKVEDDVDWLLSNDIRQHDPRTELLCSLPSHIVLKITNRTIVCFANSDAQRLISTTLPEQLLLRSRTIVVFTHTNFLRRSWINPPDTLDCRILREPRILDPSPRGSIFPFGPLRHKEKGIRMPCRCRHGLKKTRVENCLEHVDIVAESVLYVGFEPLLLDPEPCFCQFCPDVLGLMVGVFSHSVSQPPRHQ